MAMARGKFLCPSDKIMASIVLLKSETEAKITHAHVRTELERISVKLGRDFTVFLTERDGDLWFDAADGSLNPTMWSRIPPYGTDIAWQIGDGKGT